MVAVCRSNVTCVGTEHLRWVRSCQISGIGEGVWPEDLRISDLACELQNSAANRQETDCFFPPFVTGESS